jgi:DNA-binding transcriptional LysR family regulator
MARSLEFLSISPRRLQVFQLVVTTGRFSGAAHQLGIAQPSVSAHIRALEEQIGQPLFVRNSGRSPILTEAGRALYEYASDALKRSGDAASALSGMQSPSNSQLTIAAQRSIANHLLPPVLSGFLQKNSGIQIGTHSEIQENVLKLARTGQANIGLFFALGSIADLTSEVVGHQPLAFVVSPHHELANRRKISAKELSEYPLVGPLSESMFGQTIEIALRKVGIARPRFITRLQDPAGIAAVVRTGLGVACTPRCNVDTDIRNGLLKPLSLDFEPPWLQVRLAYAPDGYVSNATQQFVAYLTGYNANFA